MGNRLSSCSSALQRRGTGEKAMLAAGETTGLSI